MTDYEEQLERALASTPDVAGEAGRFEVPEPEVRQEGNVTVYENFDGTVDRLDRDPDLVLRYLQTDLGTSAHIDERGRARFTGDFSADRLFDAIESFIDAYVLCPECGAPDTRLIDQQGATMRKCDACGAVSATG